MVVHPVSHGVSRVPRYSGTQQVSSLFGYGALTPYGRPSHAVLLSYFPICRSATPENKSSGLASSAFARHYLRNHCYFLFLRVLRCFSSPGSPPARSRVPESLPAGCPIRRSADQWVFAPPRGLSQLITSFFASESQGILHVPLSPFLRVYFFRLLNLSHRICIPNALISSFVSLVS